jgi:hypothetical protein
MKLGLPSEWCFECSWTCTKVMVKYQVEELSLKQEWKSKGDDEVSSRGVKLETRMKEYEKEQELENEPKTKSKNKKVKNKVWKAIIGSKEKWELKMKSKKTKDHKE